MEISEEKRKREFQIKKNFKSLSTADTERFHLQLILFKHAHVPFGQNYDITTGCNASGKDAYYNKYLEKRY